MFVALTEWIRYYLEPVAEMIGAVVPTLLLGRILIGFARPYDFWKGSIPAMKEKSPQALLNQISSVTRTVMFADEVRTPASAPIPALTKKAENALATLAIGEE
ncbi:uncharacterized protein EV420DRAFT_1642720 [Desarmillaria tabescens]|uniref:Uncharacterized protein n=1 Tax=Armillaria tabescens TaxID=1929756 RepID=A0AA39KD75_ARMTA|nr:uncharacterized protein EV420DRAFT_1642720 [Desarmillaria tabescens]KAK0459021.1 hypothetical protein EV420DRAFT_1642720 [Desarmillaria tabescens]